MAHGKYDRVQETSTSTGATTMALIAAATRMRRFGDVLANADTCYVMIEHASAAEWQVCLATWNTGHSLTLGTVLSSSTGSAVTFSAGTKTISLVAPAVKNIVEDNNGDAFVAGKFGIGTAAVAGINLYVNKIITGSAFSYSAYINGAVQSDVSSIGAGFVTSLGTQVAAFTLPGMRHFYANQGTIGAGSAVTNQAGFQAENTLIGAANNYGFLGNIPLGANRWNFFAGGTAWNYMAGNLGIGNTSLTAYNLRVSKTITGAADSFGITSDGQIQTDVTGRGVYYQSVVGQVGGVTTNQLTHYLCYQGTLSGTVNSQYGFNVDGTLIGATNNYAFNHNIAAGANRWGFYGLGSAANYLAGSLSIGTTTTNTALLHLSGTLNALTTQNGVMNNITFGAAVTGGGIGFRANLGTAASVTMNELVFFQATNAGLGGGSVVTGQYGFHAHSSLTGATANYGFYSDIAAATGRWNFYANGTALNRFNGALGLGMTPVNMLDIAGSLGRGAPVTKAADFTLTATENWVINNKSGSTCVATLPAASAWTAREVMFKNTQAQLLDSASANVVPITGGAAAANILTAVSGRWAKLVSDGTNWIVMQVGG